MATTKSSQAVRILIAVASLVLAAVPLLATGASGQETLTQLEARMESIRGELDAATQRVEDLHAREEEVETRIGEIEREIETIEEDSGRLVKVAEERADILYRYGSTGVVEALFGSQDLSELATKTEMLSQIQFGDTEVFVKLARTQDRLESLSEELADRRSELDTTSTSLQDEAEALREQLAEVGDEYSELKEKIEQARAEAAREEAAQETTTSTAPDTSEPAPDTAPAPDAPIQTQPGASMVCPVDGPVSFIDSWGYPRSGGRSHEGTDLMADYGTPVVAIVSGTITLSDYGDSAGYWQILSGDDGNDYWYMHNQENLVNGGHVQAGEQIATVGDTGNATGVPHVHFEYHPGGGGPVNPYPLVRPLC